MKLQEFDTPLSMAYHYTSYNRASGFSLILEPAAFYDSANRMDPIGYS